MFNIRPSPSPTTAIPAVSNRAARVCRQAALPFARGGIVAWAALAGCGGDDSRVHGAVFGTDGGDSTVADGPGTPSDAPSPPVDARTDSSDTGASPMDASAEASDGSVSIGLDAGSIGDAAGCPSTVAVVGGSATSAFGATLHGGPVSPWASVWAVSSLVGSAASVPAIVAVPSGFEAVFHEAGNDALSAASHSAGWTSLTQIGAAITHDPPSIAVLGSSVHVVYRGTNTLFYHGTYSGGAWDGASDPVGPPHDGGTQSFGPSAPVVASSGGSLVVVQDGMDGLLYDQTWSGAWQSASSHPSAMVSVVSPSIVTLSQSQAGTAYDVLVVLVHQTDFKLYWTGRSSGTWTAPAPVDASALTNDPVSLAALPNGRAVLLYRGAGTDKSPYFSLFDPTASTAWTAPAPLVTPANPQLSSPPVAAAGVCGVDAVAAYAGASGVQIVRLTGSTWSQPSSVPGTSGANFVAIATSP